MMSSAAKRLMLVMMPIFWISGPAPAIAAETPLTGEEIIRQCGLKYPGDDQISRFEVQLQDRQGNVKRSVYLRLWKAYKGVNDIVDKMLLFTEFPPEAQGSAFMRATFVPELKKAADQWIYLPVLKKIRRVTIRDQGDSFLNSELTYADVTPRSVGEDNHKFLGVRKVGDLEFYVVESIPKETKPLYGKRIQWFNKAADWNDCANVRIDYYDRKLNLLKEQFVKWQRVNGAWVWDRVLVRNSQTLRASIFLTSDVRINTGLQDDIFSERTLRTGPGAIPGIKQKSATDKK